MPTQNVHSPHPNNREKSIRTAMQRAKKGRNNHHVVLMNGEYSVVPDYPQEQLEKHGGETIFSARWIEFVKDKQ